MAASVTVRLATPDDAAALSALVLRTLYLVNARDYEPVIVAAWAKDWTVDEVVAKMRQRTTYAAVQGEVIVGTAGFDGRQIKSVFVAPERHKLGIGSLLVRTVEALAMERGMDRLSLYSSLTAEGFYRRLGYDAVREMVQGGERTILMEKRLRS